MSVFGSGIATLRAYEPARPGRGRITFPRHEPVRPLNTNSRPDELPGVLTPDGNPSGALVLGQLSFGDACADVGRGAAERGRLRRAGALFAVGALLDMIHRSAMDILLRWLMDTYGQGGRPAVHHGRHRVLRRDDLPRPRFIRLGPSPATTAPSSGASAGRVCRLLQPPSTSSLLASTAARSSLGTRPHDRLGAGSAS